MSIMKDIILTKSNCNGGGFRNANHYSSTCCILLVGCIGSNTQVSTDKITHYRENYVDSVQIESPSKQAQKQ